MTPSSLFLTRIIAVLPGMKLGCGVSRICRRFKPMVRNNASRHDFISVKLALGCVVTHASLVKFRVLVSAFSSKTKA